MNTFYQASLMVALLMLGTLVVSSAEADPVGYETELLRQDTTPPLCEIAKIDVGPPTRLRVRVRDGGSGLASITVKQDKNATVNLPSFTLGFNGVIFVIAEKIDESEPSTVVLEVKDMEGNTTVCDPVLTTLSAEVPEGFSLGANYPNPFNPTTRITFQLAESNRRPALGLRCDRARGIAFGLGADGGGHLRGGVGRH